jgi:excisionase family DNA binding protein
MHPESPMLSTEEAAKYCGLSKRTLEKWRVEGGGPRYVKLGRSVRYRPTDINEFVESAVRRSTSSASEAGA